MKPPAAGMGRPKGALNKNTRELKDMIHEALENKGGAAYLERQADENPAAFLSLVGKLLPRDVRGAHEISVSGGNLLENREAAGRRIADIFGEPSVSDPAIRQQSCDD